MFGANMARVANLGRGGARLGTVSFDMFFDRQKLVGQANKAVFKALNRAGGATRLTAKRSMRARPLGKASHAGNAATPAQAAAWGETPTRLRAANARSSTATTGRRSPS
jgi:hypothetical protein